jgi:hypothetical protein
MSRRLGPVASLLLLFSPLASVASCGGEPRPAVLGPVAVPLPPASVSAEVKAAPPPWSPQPARFENPGGMWMPHQLTAHAAKLKELGLAIDPAALADPTSGVLSAIVSLGGCSASFVSPDGLVATNHHCATGALQHNSTPSQNLLENGWLAATRGDEKNNGPQARVLVTRSVTDVTPKVMDGVAKVGDDRQRFKTIEKRQKELVAACEKGHAGLRCSVASFYEGAQHYLIEQLEIRDVRLVWAPPAGVGNFGGEIDNWRWPRHTGDVSLFRAYVGKDGQPADFSPDNVPYHPPHFLRIAKAPLRESDLVFVAGYPGRTSTLKTRGEVSEAITWMYPRRQRLFEDYLARLAEVTKDDKDAQIRATSYVRRFGNSLTNTKGQLDGLVKGGLAQDKDRQEKELRAFVDGDQERKAKYGTVLDDIQKAVDKNAAHREADAQLDELSLPKLMTAATIVVRMAEERAKPDAERDPDFQARNWNRQEQALAAMTTTYHRRVDEALLGLAVERALRMPEAERSPGIAKVLGTVPPKDASPEAIKKRVSALYEGTKLADPAARADLFKKATTADLRRSTDSLLQLAQQLRPLAAESEQRHERLAGRMAVLKPKYIEAMRAYRKEPFAPDANGTLRITYGTVRGYVPAPDAPPYRPFSTLSEMVAKDRGAKPFEVPEGVRAARAANKLGPYVDETLGDVPVDFLADLHITGGNSGSATLNAKGELVGLVFDGNYEAMASDWVFVPSLTRSIHVDVRYIEWLLDAVDHGDALLKEMGVEPRIAE